MQMVLLAMWGDKPWSRAISSLTGGGPSHVALAFRDPDWPEGSGVYFEALFGRGVIGPRPVLDALEWQAARPRKRRMQAHVIPGSTELARRKLMTAETWVGAAGYGHLQIIAMLMRKKFGMRVRKRMGRVVCSEFVARVLFPDVDVRDGREFDETTPANVLRAVKKM